MLVGLILSLTVGALSAGAPHETELTAAALRMAQARSGPPVAVDVNRPQTQFDCDLPIGVNWYGSRRRCLQYLCAGQNVYNQYIFDADNRRRRNPCYGQSPTDFDQGAE